MSKVPGPGGSNQPQTTKPKETIVEIQPTATTSPVYNPGVPSASITLGVGYQNPGQMVAPLPPMGGYDAAYYQRDRENTRTIVWIIVAIVYVVVILPCVIVLILFLAGVAFVASHHPRG